MLKRAYDRVKKTKRGKELADKLEKSKINYTIIAAPGKETLTRKDIIRVDPYYRPLINTAQGQQVASLERVLAHEMGHAAGTANEADNININENPVALQLGEGNRTNWR